MIEVTRILFQIEQGDPSATEQLLPLVYNELRKLAAARMAQEMPGQTLQATALVHEAYVRLVDVDKAQHWNSRGHFFGAAAEAMRRILIDRARGKLRQKRGGQWARLDLDRADVVEQASPDQLLLLDEAIERLCAEDETAGGLVRLRYFAGLGIEDAAGQLGVSVATAYRHWSYARAWLHCEVQPAKD